MATVATILVYIVITFSISNWRIQFRRALNEADSRGGGPGVDALMNFETIKTFGSEDRDRRPLLTRRRGDYARAAVKANTSLQMLNALQIGGAEPRPAASSPSLAGWRGDPRHDVAGGITACILILQTVYAPLGTLGVNYRMIRQAFIDMEQMLDAARDRCRRSPTRPTRATCRRPPARAPTLVFDHVSFQHTARSVGLADVSFRTRARDDDGAGRPLRRRQDHLSVQVHVLSVTTLFSMRADYKHS